MPNTLSTRPLHPRIWATALAALGAAALAQLLLPQMSWSAGDFLAFALMLATAALLGELARRLLTHPRHRLMAGLAIAATFLAVWAELAVGLFGPG